MFSRGWSPKIVETGAGEGGGGGEAVGARGSSSQNWN